MELFFAYGPLKNREVQIELLDRELAVKGPDKLEGYALTEVEDNHVRYPCAHPKKNSSIDGMILEVYAEELPLMDVYQGSNYFRKMEILHSGTSAWVYIKKPDNH